MEQVEALVSGFIVGSPFAKTLGVVAEEIGTDRVRLRLPFRDEVTTIGDLVHGGAIAGLVDVSATAAFWANPEVDPSSRGTTIGFSINFLNGGRGTDLIATATVLQRGRSISIGEVRVGDANGTLVATATVTYKLDARRA